MPTFLNVEDFDLILAEPAAGRRAGLACRLYGDYEAGALSAGEGRAALSIFRALARDPDRHVRARFARFVARSPALARDIAESLAGDLPAIGSPVVSGSPVLTDDALVDLVATGDRDRQAAAARRARISAPVAAALIEVGSAEACLMLLRNPGAELPPFAFDRLAERFGDDHGMREAMLAHPGVPSRLVEQHLSAVADRLGRFVTAAGWLDPARARMTIAAAVEQSLVAHAQARPAGEIDGLVRRWLAEGRIDATFVVRAAFLGADAVLESALSAGARLPPGRVRALLADHNLYGLRGLCTRMRLSEDVLTAIMRARAAARERRGAAAAPPVAALIADPGFLPHLALSAEHAAIADEIAAAATAGAAASRSRPALKRAA